jgi:hypothetical protein
LKDHNGDEQRNQFRDIFWYLHFYSCLFFIPPGNPIWYPREVAELFIFFL